MSRARLSSLLIVLVLGAGAAISTLVGSASASQPSSTARLVFYGDVLPLAKATELGPANPATVMTLGIGLANPNPAGESALLAEIENPASPQYRHFLTPSQFASRFGVASSVSARMLSWLTSGGAHVFSTSSAHNYVEFTATVAQVQRLFDTDIDSYVAQGVHFIANATAPSTPVDVDPLAILGLNTLVHPTLPSGIEQGHKLSSASASPGASSPATTVAGQSVPAVGSSPASASGPGCTTGLGATAPTGGGCLTPQDLWGIYDMPSNNMGQNQTIAVMGEGDATNTIKDLPLFEKWMGLPTVPIVETKIPADGDFSDEGGSVEWELDTQSSTGIAPDVKQIHLYFAQHLVDPDVESDFVTWVDDPNGPTQANASFGECETTPANAELENSNLDQVNNDQDPYATIGTDAPDDLEPVAEQTLEQGVMEGRTLFAATGDEGASCPVAVLGPLGGLNGIGQEGVPLINYPAASQYAVAVGGTVVYGTGSTPDQREAEYPWPYTGGGQSFFIPEPSFQQGTANVDRPCISNVQGMPYSSVTTCRGIPDVADESGDVSTSAYYIYSDELGGESVEGGTSLASPVMVGMWTRVQAASPAGTGFADVPIYKIGNNAGEYATDFNDYTVGTNGFYQAAPGWDYVSGWGTPILTPLMKDVDHGNTTPLNPAPVATLTSGTPAVGAPSTTSEPSSTPPTAKPAPNAIACPKLSVLTYTVHGHKGARVIQASVYVNGSLVRRITGKSLSKISIKRPLLTDFTIKIVTTLTTHGHVVSRRSYTGCTRTKVVHKAEKAHHKKTAKKAKGKK